MTTIERKSTGNPPPSSGAGAPGDRLENPQERQLTPAAERALAEAAERRRQRGAEASRPAEFGGRGGPDPVRYGDWENKGIVSDF